MLQRIERVSDRMSTDLKGTRPFDKEVESNREKLLPYEEITSNPLLVQQLRASMGEAFDQYSLEMESFKRRLTNAGV